MALPRWISGGMLVVLIVTGGTRGASADTDQTRLHHRRATRRVALHDLDLAATKSGAAHRFGLLVIPVDFADDRLPGDWEAAVLSPRLMPDQGETLRHYFQVASRGNLELDIVLAPLVSLPLTRRQYSDRDFNGHSRSRDLAATAIRAVAAAGLDFRYLDNDGPDGVAGSGDDDGEVDGILILHAALGVENDPDTGLIQPLQFFLTDPISSHGVAASFYAVASMHSGPGIWAHETGHLLGLEDRYDPLLVGGELESRGGLGRFSLMASGAWGTGGGYGAALPDAYTASQVGWLPVIRVVDPVAVATMTVTPTAAVRLWTNGGGGAEFFLIETRDPVATAPFDAHVPAGQLLVYHIDENLAEGSFQQDGPDRWHLRARLLEADGDDRLALGLDDGGPTDLFPGAGGVGALGPFTVPSTATYQGTASGVSLRGITPVRGGIQMSVELNTQPAVVFESAFRDGPVGWGLQLNAVEVGTRLSGLECVLSVVSWPSFGAFDGPDSNRVTIAMMQTSPGHWASARPVRWQLRATGAGVRRTQFRYVFRDGAQVVHDERRWWVWDDATESLDFRRQWPGEWTAESPSGNLDTTWHRWQDGTGLTENQAGVLVCTGVRFDSPAAWPDVTYANQAAATLTSAALGPGLVGVRLTHAIEVEMLRTGHGLDGGLVSWVDPAGKEIEAVPLGGYGGVVDAHAGNLWHGRDAFVAGNMELEGTLPLWRTDTLLLPAEGSGPWRLRLMFGANAQWRARGWVIADIEPVRATDANPAFILSWDGDLRWRWPWGTGGLLRFVFEVREGNDRPWRLGSEEQVAADFAGDFVISGQRLKDILGGVRGHWNQLRVVGNRNVGRVASQPIGIDLDGGPAVVDGLGRPWPNPAVGEVRLLTGLGVNRGGDLLVYDVRGRLVWQQVVGPGVQMVVWDGATRDGSRAPAGVYYVQIRGAGSPVTQKVVLVR